MAKQITKLARMRFETGMTIQEIVDKSGISRETIQKIEKGSRDNPGIETLKKIAKSLNCKVSDIWEVK